MAYKFQSFERPPPGAAGRNRQPAFVSISPGVGGFRLNANAIELMPARTVVLLFDATERVVALEPCDESVPDAYRVTPQGAHTRADRRPTGASISGMAFCRFWNITVPVGRSKPYPAWLDNGRLLFGPVDTIASR